MPKHIPNTIARRVSPEEEELAKKRETLTVLQAELAERELYLTNLRAELSAFEGRYLRQVGVLYGELDEWYARIAELRAEQEGTEHARSAAAKARAQAEDSHAAAHGEEAKATEFTPTPELKSLFRQVAKRVHPDLCADQADRQKREQLMADANAAYQRGDAAALEQILAEYESSPESVRGNGVATDLVRVIRQIRQVESRLSQIELEIRGLVDSEVAKLKAKTEAAMTEGRDLLTQIATDLTGRIQVARRTFESRLAAREKV